MSRTPFTQVKPLMMEGGIIVWTECYLPSLRHCYYVKSLKVNRIPFLPKGEGLGRKRRNGASDQAQKRQKDENGEGHKKHDKKYFCCLRSNDGDGKMEFQALSDSCEVVQSQIARKFAASLILTCHGKI
ncbi:hypothetical protein AVEN_175720-1 [Araneus ventricosus]|uniref:Uncharacterized protein n=1 Tax=Araneus ventricosus TaxID=182803 RepID=A0A4Y2RJK5_ARAVE|nr:hypothetical protein AVEN_175720-1 [Araneus ventricosus]